MSWVYRRYAEYRAVQALMEMVTDSHETSSEAAETRRLALHEQRANTNRCKWLAKNQELLGLAPGASGYRRPDGRARDEAALPHLRGVPGDRDCRHACQVSVIQPASKNPAPNSTNPTVGRQSRPCFASN